jgi:hypothetical protein
MHVMMFILILVAPGPDRDKIMSNNSVVTSLSLFWWLNSDCCQNDMIAKSLGVELVAQYRDGKKVLDLRGNVASYRTDIPTPAGIAGLLDLQLMIYRVDQMAKDVPLENPHDCKYARQWDAMSALSWIKSRAWTKYGLIPSSDMA